MTFTDDVTFDGDLEEIFSLEPASRRLLEQRESEQAGKRRILADYQIVRVDEKTVKIVLTGEDAENYEVNIK